MEQQTEKKMNTKEPRVGYLTSSPTQASSGSISSLVPQHSAVPAPSCVPGCSRSGPVGGCYLPKRSSVLRRVAWGTKASRNMSLNCSLPPVGLSPTSYHLAGRASVPGPPACHSNPTCPAQQILFVSLKVLLQGRAGISQDHLLSLRKGWGLRYHPFMCSSLELGILPGDPCG